MGNSVDPDQLASLEADPADLDLHCFNGRIYPGSGGQGSRILTKMGMPSFLIIFSIFTVSCSGFTLFFSIPAWFVKKTTLNPFLSRSFNLSGTLLSHHSQSLAPGK